MLCRGRGLFPLRVDSASSAAGLVPVVNDGPDRFVPILAFVSASDLKVAFGQ